jgi:phosphoserine phosphatase RsbU/P
LDPIPLIGLPSGQGDSPMFDEMYSALVDQARDMMFVMDEDGIIVFTNNAAVARYGYSLDEFIGMRVSQVRAPHTRPLIKQQMADAIRHGWLFETVHITRDGREFPVEVSSRGVEISGARYLVSVVRDVSVRTERQTEREALLADLEVANSQLEGLLRVVSGAVGSLSITTLMDAVMEALNDVMKADGSMFLVVEGKDLVLRSYDGFDERCEGFRMKADQGFAGKVAAAGEALWTDDVKSFVSPISLHAMYDIKAMYGIPLYLDGSLYGVLECAWADDRLVSEAERIMLTVAGDRIMAAVAGVQRYERTAKAQIFDSALCDVSEHLGRSHDLSVTVPAALDVASRVLDCEVAGYGSFADGIWKVVYGLGISPGTRIAVPGHPGRVREVKESLPVVRIDATSDTAGWLRESMGLSEAAIVPVMTGGEWIGAVLFGRIQPAAGFDDLTTDFIRRFSATLSLAIASTREYDAEHRIAETLQEALLTISGPNAGVRLGKLYRSATSAARVGGDFYDVFEMEGDRLGVMVGDVSGKGLEAAVFTTLVKHTVRAFAVTEDSVAEVMTMANRVLSHAARLPEFASLVLMRVDKRTGETAYCCAGHPPGLIRRTCGRVDVLECKSPVVGVSDSLEFVAHQCRLERGDIVILYTDGITEARSPSGEFFGDERLIQALAESEADAYGLPQVLLGVVNEFAAGTLADDIAIIAFSLDE